MAGPTACFVSASGQNIFFAELIDALREALEQAGIETEESVDRFPPPRPGLVNVFVPHEYIPLVLPPAYPTAEQLQRTVAIATEQPGTDWFNEALYVARREGVITIDINRLGVAELRRQGIAARFMPLGYVPAWDSWGGVEPSDRPIDVTFMGGFSDRRAALIARCGHFLTERRAEFRVYEAGPTYTARSRHFFAGSRKWRHLAATKVILNVHQNENEYLEWQRFIGAMSNGCVVLSERCAAFDPLVPGRDFVMGDYDSLPLLLGTLLDDDEWRSSIRRSAYRLLRDRLPLTKSIDVLVQAVEEQAAKPSPASRTQRVVSPPAPRSRPARPAEWIRLEREGSEFGIVRMALKRVLMQQTKLSERLVHLERASASTGEEVVTRHGMRRSQSPRVTVVVTVYGYERLVDEALDSIALSDFEDYEVVVVDDASHDGSAEAARRALDGRPWVDGTVVVRPHNGGLAAARNTALDHARGEYVFILDADNSVYPHALGRLVAALDENPDIAFAYGMCDKFSTEGSVGLVSWIAWERERLRLGNFVDAMAMIRRERLIEVGGYTTDPRFNLGWEDFCLWCSFAERGLEGMLVPEVLCRYRSGRHSLLSVTNISALEAWGALLDKHGFLAETTSV